MAQINKPTQYFEPVLYTGDDSNNRTINTTENFQADLFWIKDRGGAGFHIWNDVIRSSGWLSSNTTNAESAYSALGWDNTAPASTGFTVDKGTNGTINGSGNSFVSWCWNAGGTASSNTDGSITSSVSANTTSGFSIVSFNGGGSGSDNIGHGLGSTPKIVLIKDRDGATDWLWYTTAIDGSYDTLRLNTTGAKTDSSYTAPTSSVFSFPANSSNNYIAYCFAEKKGFSKFGSYTGNGSADGTFIYTGFKPSWVLVRNATEAAMEWVIHDSKRNTFNVTDKELKANSSAAEATQDRFDFTSQGFKVRNASSYVNRSGQTIIYMAFAESPLVGTNNIPATAR